MTPMETVKLIQDIAAFDEFLTTKIYITDYKSDEERVMKNIRAQFRRRFREQLKPPFTKKARET